MVIWFYMFASETGYKFMGKGNLGFSYSYIPEIDLHYLFLAMDWMAYINQGL